MMMRSTLYQTNMLSQFFLQCQLTETTVHRQTCRSTRTHYPDSEPTSHCSFSLILRAQRRSNKYQFNGIWFELTGVRTYDIPIYSTIYNEIHSTILQYKVIVDLPFSVSTIHMTMSHPYLVDSDILLCLGVHSAKYGGI